MQQIISSWSIDARQVYSIVDEMFLAGELRETSQTKVLKIVWIGWQCFNFSYFRS